MVLLLRVLIRVSMTYVDFLFHFLCGYIQYNKYCRFRDITASRQNGRPDP